MQLTNNSNDIPTDSSFIYQNVKKGEIYLDPLNCSEKACQLAEANNKVYGAN